jgi:multidrug transporter EmrE-like cation transporter
MRVYVNEASWQWYKAIFRILFFILIWVAGSAATLLLLKSKKSIPAQKSYAIISSIGLLFLSIITLRFMAGSYHSKKVITVDNYSERWFESNKEFKKSHYFKDYDERIVNLKNIMKKRQISLFSIVDSKPLKKELINIAERDSIDYYHIDLDYAFKNVYSLGNLEEFWTRFSIDLISNLAKNPEAQKTLVFSWTINRNKRRSETETLSYTERIKLEEQEKYKLNHFVEILETICTQMKNFNILILTESNELLYWIKGSSLSRITSVYKLSAHEVKYNENSEHFRSSKLTEEDKNAKMVNSVEELNKKLEQDEATRTKKFNSYSKIKKKEELESRIIEDEKQRAKRVKKEQYEREQRIKPYMVSLKDAKNKAVLLKVLKGSKTIGKNEWVQINQIPEFYQVEDRFDYLVDKRVLERSGGVVKFVNDDVHRYYSDELTSSGKIRISEVKDVSLDKEWRRDVGGGKKGRGRERRWWVRLLWGHWDEH